jgi:hypothetical protein
MAELKIDEKVFLWEWDMPKVMRYRHCQLRACGEWTVPLPPAIETLSPAPIALPEVRARDIQF